MQNGHDETMPTTWLEGSQTTINNNQHLVREYQAMTVAEDHIASDTCTSSIFPSEIGATEAISTHASTPPPGAAYERYATYPAMLVADKTVVTAGQLTDVEQWLFDRMPQSRDPNELARHLLHHDGRQMTADDVIMLYRIAYWKSKPWEDIDNVCLAKLVKEDMDQIWVRVAGKVRLF
ncbi:hypothetical protein LTR86_010983 [Recurvomyces mirabilis]|nr:hypothetical protein LTR86_010983 [Recurvomyces mirabilis]